MDNPDKTLSGAIRQALSNHDVEVARDAFDAIYRIDCADRSYDAIFCDLARGDLPGPELWAYLSLTRGTAAARMVFVASAPLRPETKTFLRCIPNPCVDFPLDAEVLDTLAARHASRLADSEPEAVTA